ncbi:MAG: hypothetical protein Q7O66_23675 [Dehalococcoidia bacterium]|nr:hypothetical protein [Dehalococcoidia bacterium]
MQCVAHKKNGEQCRKSARLGYRVCSHHGAGFKARPGGRPITNGKYSRRFSDVQAQLVRAQATTAQRELQTRIMGRLFDGLPDLLARLEQRADLDSRNLKNAIAEINADTDTMRAMQRLTRLLAATAIEWAQTHMPGDEAKAKKGN